MKTLNFLLSASLLVLLSSSRTIIAQPFDPSIEAKILRVYNITATTAVVEGSCSLSIGAGVAYGGCSVLEFEYGTFVPLSQTAKEMVREPPYSGRATTTLTALPPDTLLFVRVTTDDGNGFLMVSKMFSFRTAKSEDPSGYIVARVWDEECATTRACVNVSWDSKNSPFTSAFVGINGSAEYNLIGTSDSCSLCRVPVDKNKTYRFVIYTSRTPGKTSRPTGTLLAEMTYKIP